MSSIAGFTGLSALTLLVYKLAKGDLPDSILPLFSVATPLPTQSRPEKIQPIAIGKVLRLLVIWVLLQSALSESWYHLFTLQMATGVRASMKSIVHDARMPLERHRKKHTHVLVSFDAENVFNQFSCHQILSILPLHIPSLARLIDLIYICAPPSLVIHSS